MRIRDGEGEAEWRDLLGSGVITDGVFKSEE